MSVDRTIEELSGTLAQLGILVEHINTQIVSISSRVNLTLDNFDRAVEDIARDAGLMTGQVGDTVSQIPNSWVFYILFLSIIAVLTLLSVLILINLVTRVCAIYREIKTDRTRSSSVMRPFYADAKKPLNAGCNGSAATTLSPRSGCIGKTSQMCALPMEAEPKRYGGGGNLSQTLVSGIDDASYMSPSRVQQTGSTTDVQLTRRQLYNFSQKPPPPLHYNRQLPPSARYMRHSPQHYGTHSFASRTNSDASQLSAPLPNYPAIGQPIVSPHAEAV